MNTFKIPAIIQISLSEIQKVKPEVTKEWIELSKEERENGQAGKDLTAKKKALTEELKSLEGATGDTRRNVGNYTASILEAAEQNQFLAGTFPQIGQGINATKGAFNSLICESFNPRCPWQLWCKPTLCGK